MNGEAKMSHHLWTFCALLVLQTRRGDTELIREDGDGGRLVDNDRRRRTCDLIWQLAVTQIALEGTLDDSDVSAIMMDDDDVDEGFAADATSGDDRFPEGNDGTHRTDDKVQYYVRTRRQRRHDGGEYELEGALNSTAGPAADLARLAGDGDGDGAAADDEGVDGARRNGRRDDDRRRDYATRVSSFVAFAGVGSTHVPGQDPDTRQGPSPTPTPRQYVRFGTRDHLGSADPGAVAKEPGTSLPAASALVHVASLIRRLYSAKVALMLGPELSGCALGELVDVRLFSPCLFFFLSRHPLLFLFIVDRRCGGIMSVAFADTFCRPNWAITDVHCLFCPHLASHLKRGQQRQSLRTGPKRGERRRWLSQSGRCSKVGIRFGTTSRRRQRALCREILMSVLALGILLSRRSRVVTRPQRRTSSPGTLSLFPWTGGEEEAGHATPDARDRPFPFAACVVFRWLAIGFGGDREDL